MTVAITGEQAARIEMVARLKATHEQPAWYVWVDLPEGIGWVPCPHCSLPMVGKVLYDNRTHKGVCQDCGEDGLNKLQGKV